jgi:uncharacterized repeat protein (TIGR03803 family)
MSAKNEKRICVLSLRGVGFAVIVGIACLVAATSELKAQTETVLYNFTGTTDRGYPWAGLIKDDSGNLYGTTGGYPYDYGCGTVFKVTPTGAESVLHTFTGADGCTPQAVLVRDRKGNLYGTTSGGGANLSGAVFEITAAGTEKVLYSFLGPDGQGPHSGLIRDESGNLYGTTFIGGAHNAGTVFELSPNGTEKVLYSFTGGADGGGPWAGLVRGTDGTLYGTTIYGGSTNCNYGCGVVFKLSPAGTEKVLYNFLGGKDGRYPQSGLVRDSKGNLYGATSVLGGNGGCDSEGCGTIFEITANGEKKTLYSFSGKDGSVPNDTLILGKRGTLYGVTYQGGAYGGGAVFELTSNGVEKTLYSFTGAADGDLPIGPLVFEQGSLYGVTFQGGASGFGTVFKVTP